MGTGSGFDALFVNLNKDGNGYSLGYSFSTVVNPVVDETGRIWSLDRVYDSLGGAASVTYVPEVWKLNEYQFHEKSPLPEDPSQWIKFEGYGNYGSFETLFIAGLRQGSKKLLEESLKAFEDCKNQRCNILEWKQRGFPSSAEELRKIIASIELMDPYYKNFYKGR
jgi:hypothetical protein